MMSLRLFLMVLVALLTPGTAVAQPDTQLWGDFTLTWIKNDRFTFGVDTAPRVLVSAPSGDPGWATLDITPSIEYSRGRWVDVIGELRLARTWETNDLDSIEVAPRVGFQFHVLSNLRDRLDKERQPGHRLVIRNLLRFEWRNFFYSNGQPEESSQRLRDRVEVLYSLNRPRITDDGSRYLVSDVEWFWPRGEPDERFANQQRIRAGIGYRHSHAWRFETLYIWDRSRDSANQGFSDDYHAVDLRVRRVW